MRRLYTYLGVFVTAGIIAASCGKGPDVLTPHETPNDGDFTYVINGLKDTSLERTDDVRYLVYVEKKSGKAENVVLSAQDVPEGMEVIFDPISADTASFNTTLLIKTKRVKVGEYVINVRGASATTRISNNPIKIKVLPYSNEALGLVGNYTESGVCTKGNVNHNVTVEKDPTENNKIYINGIMSGVLNNTVYGTVNPTNKTIYIFKQLQNSVYYEGEGTYDDDKIVLNYRVTGAVINENCTSTLTRR
jgi:hypothetical protein